MSTASPAQTYRVMTQEAGTGKWFALVIYHNRGGSETQWQHACELRDTLHHLGLIALATAETEAE